MDKLFELVEMYRISIRPLPITENRNRYIRVRVIILTGYKMKLLEVETVPNIKTTTMIADFIYEVITKHGTQKKTNINGSRIIFR